MFEIDFIYLTYISFGASLRLNLNKQGAAMKISYDRPFNVIHKLAPFAAFLLWASPSLAATEATIATSDGSPFGYAGVLLGGNGSPSLEGRLTPTIGLTFGAKLAPALGVAVMGTYYGQMSSGSLLGLPTGAAAKTLTITGQVNYFVGGFHAGGEVGATVSSWSGNLSSIHLGDSANGIVFGPVVGYDLTLGKNLSIGAEGHFLISTVKSGVDNLQAFAALKYWN